MQGIRTSLLVGKVLAEVSRRLYPIRLVHRTILEIANVFRVVFLDFIVDTRLGPACSSDTRYLVRHFAWRRRVFRGIAVAVRISRIIGIAHLFIDEIVAHPALDDGLIALFLHGCEGSVEQILFFRRQRFFNIHLEPSQ